MQDVKQEVNLGAAQRSLPMDPSTIYGQGIMQSKPGIGNSGKCTGSCIAELELNTRAYNFHCIPEMELNTRAYKHVNLQIEIHCIPEMELNMRAYKHVHLQIDFYCILFGKIKHLTFKNKVLS